MNPSKGVRELESPEEFARRLNLRFTDPLLLSRALTHRSYLNEHREAVEDNERLEFLGDAVLDYVVALWLYHRFPEMREGDMTRIRASLVSTEQLAVFARQIGLDRAIRLGRGEEEGGGRDRTSLLCDAFEALVGAIIIDQGEQAVRNLVEPLFRPAAMSIILDQSDKDPKSLLQEWAQSKGYGIPQYEIVSSQGPDHARVFEVDVLVNGTCYGHGVGSSIRAASMQAASMALEALGVR